MDYDYKEAVKDDIREYIDNNINLNDYADFGELEEELNETLWLEDSVTGNASGSYTFTRWTAREYVISGGMEFLQDACGSFGITAEDIGNFFLNEDWELMDVTIRCYLLAECIAEVLEAFE